MLLDFIMDGFDNTSSSSLNSNLLTHHVQSVNNIYELQSIIHNLTIEKQKAQIMYRNAINQNNQQSSAYIKQIATLEEANRFLTVQNEELSATLNLITSDHQELKKSYADL